MTQNCKTEGRKVARRPREHQEYDYDFEHCVQELRYLILEDKMVVKMSMVIGSYPKRRSYHWVSTEAVSRLLSSVHCLTCVFRENLMR